MLLTYQSPPHKFGAFTWLESSQSENVTFLANAMLCESTNVSHRQETMMSWNTKSVWKHRLKMALLLMLTPTFKHLPPTSSWTHLITLTEEVSDMPDKHVIFFFLMICWDLRKWNNQSSNVMEGPHTVQVRYLSDSYEIKKINKKDQKNIRL